MTATLWEIARLVSCASGLKSHEKHAIRIGGNR